MTAIQITGGEGGSYVATVAGITLPIDAYAAEPGTDGRVVVSLVIAADQVSIGIPPARHAEPQPEHRNQVPVSTWGNPAISDPRANIPGWAPPPPAADAGRRGTGEHRQVGETTTMLRALTRPWGLA